MPKCVFGQLREALWNYLNKPNEELYQIFCEKYDRAIATFKNAKVIDGGKEIRLPLNYGD